MRNVIMTNWSCIVHVSTLCGRYIDTTVSGGDDYVSVVETVTFSVDETRKNVTVMIRADRNIEDFEEFSVVLSPLNNPENPFPVRVNQNEGTTVVEIRDEEGKSKDIDTISPVPTLLSACSCMY